MKTASKKSNKVDTLSSNSLNNNPIVKLTVPEHEGLLEYMQSIEKSIISLLEQHKEDSISANHMIEGFEIVSNIFIRSSSLTVICNIFYILSPTRVSYVFGYKMEHDVSVSSNVKHFLLNLFTAIELCITSMRLINNISSVYSPRIIIGSIPNQGKIGLQISDITYSLSVPILYKSSEIQQLIRFILLSEPAKLLYLYKHSTS